jgi:hypothetical protein
MGSRDAESIVIGPRGLVHARPFIASTILSPSAPAPAFFKAS